MPDCTEGTARHPSEDSPLQNAASQEAPRRTVLSWLNRRKGALTAWALTVSLLVLLLWPHMIVTIQPGRVGVLYKRFWGGTVMTRLYPEGTHVLFPWDTMFIFDTRLQEENYSCTVPTRSGLLISLEVTAYYHPQAEKTPILLTTVGQNYREKLVLPALEASVRGMASEHEAEEFYTGQSNIIQGKIHVSMMQAMGRNPVIIDNFFIRTVTLPGDVATAIEQKVTAWQNVLEAAERYKARFIEAQAVRMTQEIVNKGLSESFLRWQGVEATRKLAESENSKVVVVGGKDGLPIILNTEDRAARPPAPGAAPGAVPGTAPQAAPGTAPEAAPAPSGQRESTSFSDRIAPGVLQEGLDKIEKLFGADFLSAPAGPAVGRPSRGATVNQ